MCRPACTCSATSAAGGGGGGGGAIALIAPVVTITGTVDVSGGRGAYASCYWGGDGGDGTVWVHTGRLDVTGNITRGALTTFEDLRLDAWTYRVPFEDYEWCAPLDIPRP